MEISNAATLGSVIMMTFLLARGYYVQKFLPFVAWIKYSSTSYYTYKLQLGSQFHEYSTYSCEGGGTCKVGDYSGVRLVGLGGQAVAVFALVAYVALRPCSWNDVVVSDMSTDRDVTAIDLENGRHNNGHANGEVAADREDNHDKENENESDNVLFKRANLPITLKFEDVVYKIKVPKPEKSVFSKGGKTVEKIILKGITGVVRPGEILAMLGPSGSGKTTLLTALGGRLGGGLLEGRVTYNGRPFSNSLKRATGFVTQDDIMYPHLTVAETLTYTALLRLPKTLSKPEKVAHAEAVLTQLGLTQCRNSVIGDRFTRGVSGGERKRVSIGQEMLVNPSLLLLDEPTSGLDSTTAQRIVREVWGLAKGGRTVVMTIHQPSSRLFYMFHKVLLLAEGNPLYFGEGAAAMAYFESVGYAPSITMNPADFLLDLANGLAPDEVGRGTNDVRQVLISAYKEHQEQRLKEELRITEDYGHKEGNKHKDFCRWPTTWWQQFDILLRRGVKERKHESFSVMKVGQVLVVALLCGLLWWQSDINHLQDKIGLLFFYSAFWGFFPMFNAIFTFPQERSMLDKERSSGMYRLSSYFMARIVGDLPMELVLPTIFLTMTYWMAAMRADPVSFLRTLFTLLYSVLVAQGVGLAIGAIVMNQKSATTLGSVVMLSFLLAGGYYVQKVPQFIAWIRYVSISHFTYKLLLGSQFDEHSTYPCSNPGGSCLVGEYPAVREVGLSGQAVAAVALGVMFVGYRLIAYIALMRIGVAKR